MSVHSAGTTEERLLQVTVDMVRHDIADGSVPGAVVLVVPPDGVSHLETLGLQDPSRGVPMQADTIFPVASLTKPLVSVAALRLVERGALALGHAVDELLPELGSLRMVGGACPARPVTIYDLLRHTAGFTYGFFPRNAVRQQYRDEGIDGCAGATAEQWLRALATIPLLHQPGTVFEYSVATDVLGHLLERRCRRPLDEVLAELVLDPLGMRDTAFWLGEEALGRLARPLDTDDDRWVLRRFRMDRQPRRLSGGSGLASTAPDYARFLQALLNGGERDGVRLLNPDTLDAMCRDHLHGIRRRVYLPGDDYGFGLGVAVAPRADSPASGRPRIVTWGGITGAGFWLDLSRRRVVLVLMQAPSRWTYYRAALGTLIADG